MTERPLFSQTIGVVMGGCSSEKEISLKTGHAIAQALKNSGCRVASIELQGHTEQEVLTLLKENHVDLVFIAMHGAFGEDGTLQAILEERHIPYTGSDSSSSRLAMNKIATQQRLQENGICVPEHWVVDLKPGFQKDEWVARFNDFPIVVKPAGEGSSVGITIVQHASELPSALDLAATFDKTILIERYIAGREITVGILGRQALAPVEIRPRNAFFDFQAKYEKGKTDYIIPAEISQTAVRSVQQEALRAFDLLRCRDFARADFILDDRQRAYFLEMNTIPGFTATSLLPMAARENGYSFENLCLTILGYALERKLKHCQPSSPN